MSVTISGDGTITGLSAGGLPDGTVTAADLAAGAARANFGAGAVLQVVSGFTDNYLTSTAQDTSWVTLTGLTASITPSSASSKILIMCHIGKLSNASGSTLDDDRQMNVLLSKVGITDLGIGKAFGSRMRVTTGVNDGPHHVAGRGGTGCAFQYLDSPATTSSITYQVYASGHSGELWAWNRAAETTDSGDAPQATTGSGITLMEISG
jgi:hypothetical protein